MTFIANWIILDDSDRIDVRNRNEEETDLMKDLPYLHYEFDLGINDAVEVTLDKQANVRLLDAANFSQYRRGLKHRYYGGLAKESPVRIPAPRAGHWHLVIDLGGYGGTVRASARVLQEAS